jgi:hypothetical protein
MVTVDDFADRPSRALNDNEVLEIGRSLRFLAILELADVIKGTHGKAGPESATALQAG